jgi:SAM-dependent methyltransferase
MDRTDQSATRWNGGTPMHLGLIADNPAEWKALACRQVPVPFLEVHFSFWLARAIVAATRLGLFEALARSAATAAEIADRCQTDSTATEKLMIALAGSGYVCVRDGRYALTSSARTWLVSKSPRSLVDSVLSAFDDWDLTGRVEDYVRTGTPVHERMSAHRYERYRRSTRALAGQVAHEVARDVPVPFGATDIIDVGGSSGQLSRALCGRHPQLRSVVLNSPEPGTAAAAAVPAEEANPRIVRLEGDALAHDFGVGSCDVVLLSNLARHLTASQNADLFGRLGRALRPRGVFAVVEPIRLDHGEEVDQFAALNDLYLGMSCQSGAWAAGDFARWQRDAGLRPAAQPITLGGGEAGLQLAVKY